MSDINLVQTDNIVAIKRTGKNAATEIEEEIYNTICSNAEKLSLPIEKISVIVTDEEHEILSPDYEVPFKFRVNAENTIKYNSVIDAFNDLCEESSSDTKIILPLKTTNTRSYNQALMFVLNLEKFTNDKEARMVLLSTAPLNEEPALIIYKSDDRYWGSPIPDFSGQNELGSILMKIRELFLAYNL